MIFDRNFYFVCCQAGLPKKLLQEGGTQPHKNKWDIPSVTKQQIQQKQKERKKNLIIRTQEYNNKWDILSVTKLQETDSFHKWQAFNYACNI